MILGENGVWPRLQIKVQSEIVQSGTEVQSWTKVQTEIKSQFEIKSQSEIKVQSEIKSQSEKIVSRTKSQQRTSKGTTDLAEAELQQGLRPWNCKTLILGDSESGKSTLLKSLRLHVEGPYTLEERQAFKEIIFDNAVQSMRIVLEAMESLEIPLDNSRNENHVKTIFTQPTRLEGTRLRTKVVDAILALYMDYGVKNCLERSKEYHLPDSAK